MSHLSHVRSQQTLPGRAEACPSHPSPRGNFRDLCVSKTRFGRNGDEVRRKRGTSSPAKMLDRASWGSVFSERRMRPHLVVISRVGFQYATEVHFAPISLDIRGE